MLLAELEIYHSRPVQPTRRVALGSLVLPVDPAPGFGGLLLGAVLAAHLVNLDDDLVPDVQRLIAEVGSGARVVQPRLRHRYQVDRHGLSSSVHRLTGEGDDVSFEFNTTGTDLAQVLGAIYAVERLATEHRQRLVPVLQKAVRWRGPIGPALIAHLAGAHATALTVLADPRGWALELLGFDAGTTPSKREVTAAYRKGMRAAHPDHGGSKDDAAKTIRDLNEARRILTAKVPT